MPPSGSIAWVTTFFSKQEKEVGCFLRLRDEPTGRELYQSLLEEKDNIDADLDFPVKWDDTRRMIIRCRKVTGEWPPVNDKEVDSYLTETINGLVNVFRPRLARLSGI